MNEKWFNYAITLTIVMIFVNSFITIAATQPDQNGNYSSLLDSSSTSALSYTEQKTKSDFTVNAEVVGSSNAPTEGAGLTVVKRSSDGQPIGLNAFDAATTMAFGVEKVMLKLNAVFPAVGALFLAFAAIAFFIKAIAAAWLGSVLIRSILGRNV